MSAARGRDSLQPGDQVRVQDGELQDTLTVLSADNWLIWTTGGTFRMADLRESNSSRYLIGKIRRTA